MPKDFWIGLGGLGIAALYWYEASKIRISPLDGPVTAQGLPKSLAYALGILAIALILRAVHARFAAVAAETEPPAPLGERMRPHLRAAGMLGIGVVYLLLIPYFGYGLCVMALMLAVSLYSGAGLTRKTIAVAVVGAVLFHLLFVELLGIPLPDGSLIGKFF